jgi:hypothetical protein
MTAQVYLDLLAERAEQLLDHGRAAAYPVSLAASWAVAFDRLVADDPATLQLLSLVAWLAPDPVPLTLITQHPQQLPEPLANAVCDPLAVADRTAALRRRSMARITPDSVQLHRVPAALLRGRTAGEIRDAGGWAATAVQPRLGRGRRWGGSAPSARRGASVGPVLLLLSDPDVRCYRQGAGGVADVEAVGAGMEHPPGVGVVPGGEGREVQGEGDSPASAGCEADLGVRLEPPRWLVRGRG